jgi:DNA-binding transcriptional regulator GbsR (MarR family)
LVQEKSLPESQQTRRRLGSEPTNVECIGIQFKVREFVNMNMDKLLKGYKCSRFRKDIENAVKNLTAFRNSVFYTEFTKHVSLNANESSKWRRFVNGNAVEEYIKKMIDEKKKHWEKKNPIKHNYTTPYTLHLTH